MKEKLQKLNNTEKNHHTTIIVICLAFIMLLGFGYYINRINSITFQQVKNAPAKVKSQGLLSPTATIDPSQIKATYTFYIHSLPQKSTGALSLSPSDTGKTFNVYVGTAIFLVNFGIINHRITQTSSQEIFTNPDPKALPGSAPANSIGGYGVYKAGLGKITVIQLK